MSTTVTWLHAGASAETSTQCSWCKASESIIFQPQTTNQGPNKNEKNKKETHSFNSWHCCLMCFFDIFPTLYCLNKGYQIPKEQLFKNISGSLSFQLFSSFHFLVGHKGSEIPNGISLHRGPDVWGELPLGCGVVGVRPFTEICGFVVSPWLAGMIKTTGQCKQPAASERNEILVVTSLMCREISWDVKQHVLGWISKSLWDPSKVAQNACRNPGSSSLPNGLECPFNSARIGLRDKCLISCCAMHYGGGSTGMSARISLRPRRTTSWNLFFADAERSICFHEEATASFIAASASSSSFNVFMAGSAHVLSLSPTVSAGVLIFTVRTWDGESFLDNNWIHPLNCQFTTQLQSCGWKGSNSDSKLVEKLLASSIPASWPQNPVEWVGYQASKSMKPSQPQ